MKSNNIKIYTNFTDDFCIKMCKYFADKNIIKELDNQIYSDNDMLWFIYEEDNILKCFLSIKDLTSHYYLDNFYTIPKYRGIGIAKYLLHYVLNYINNKPIKLVTRNDIALQLYLKNDFIVYKQIGRYKYLIREVYINGNK